MKKISAVASYLGIVSVVALTVLTGSDVIGRYLFNSPVPGTYELTEIMMVLPIAIGIAIATAKNNHINVDALFVKFPASMQHVLLITASIIGVLVFAIMSWKGMETAVDSVKCSETTTLLKVPVYPFKFVLALAFLLSAIFLIEQTVHLLRNKQS